MAITRAFHDIDRPTCRDRLAEARAGLKGCPKPARICRFDGLRLLLGHDTQHRTKPARLWRMRLRIKGRANKAPNAQPMG